jgi:hypothetical protein
MAGRVEERGRRDNVAESIEQTFINLQAGSAAEQLRDNPDSGEAPARVSPRERRKGGTTRLDLADVLGPGEAASRIRSRSSPLEPDNPRTDSSEMPARRTSRERRRGGTTRLDLADVLGSGEMAGRIRSGISPAASHQRRRVIGGPSLPKRPQGELRANGARAVPPGWTSRMFLDQVKQSTRCAAASHRHSWTTRGPSQLRTAASVCRRRRPAPQLRTREPRGWTDKSRLPGLMFTKRRSWLASAPNTLK